MTVLGHHFLAMAYLERSLFIVGNQNDGKSSQIRDVFRDTRLHNNGISRIGDNGRLPDWIHISNERFLHIRLTSPHEYGDGFDEFTSKIDAKNDFVGGKYRWNFMGALQTNAFRNMPNSEDVAIHFNKKYRPERSRLILIYKNFSGKTKSQNEMDRISAACASHDIEFAMIDATANNGLILSDFFDFT